MIDFSEPSDDSPKTYKAYYSQNDLVNSQEQRRASHNIMIDFSEPSDDNIDDAFQDE